MTILYTNLAIKYMYQHLPMQDPPKCTQIGIFGFENIASGNSGPGLESKSGIICFSFIFSPKGSHSGKAVE
jgi:hypothetical protein